MLKLDGSTLEGGGQLVRVALAISAICNIPVHIHSIRANRARKGQPRPDRGKIRGRGASSKTQQTRGNSKTDGGLKESHLAALVWLATQCEADVEGAEVGSREVIFFPRARKTTKQASRLRTSTNDGNVIELHNPGSVWLIFQALYPFMVFGTISPSSDSNANTFEATLKGGTNVSKSMSAEYVQQVFLPTCERIGLPSTSIEVIKRGWASSAPSIGEVKIRVTRSAKPFSLAPFNLTERNTIHKVSISVVADPEDSRNTVISRLSELIPSYLDLPDVEIDVPVNDLSGDPRRFYIMLVAHTSTGCVLGRDFLGSGRLPKNAAETQKIIENACQTVVRELKHEIQSGGCVDEHMQDQLVVFQALASGMSKVDGGSGLRFQDSAESTEQNMNEDEDGSENETERVGDENGSLHTRTVRWVLERMLRKKGIAFENGGVCKGIGWNNNSSQDKDLKQGMERLNLDQDQIVT